MGHAQFAFKKAEQQRQSSVTTLFTWRWLKQTAPHLAGNPDWGCPTLCVTPYAAAQQDWTNYRRTCKFTQDLAAHSHTYKYMCWHVHVSWPNIFKGSEGWGAPRADANVNMHSNGGAASRAGVNVTKCCQTFARTLAWQRQNANVHTQFQVCVRALCVCEQRGRQRKIKVLNSI